MVSCWDTETGPAVPAAESVNLMVKLKVPAAVGVPVITGAPVLALALRLSPPGNLPAVICHVNGAVPPLPSDTL